jgi:hypothetical protein
LLCNSHALLYHHLFCLSAFHVGFSFQKKSKTTFTQKKKTLLLHHFLQPFRSSIIQLLAPTEPTFDALPSHGVKPT